MDAIKVAGVFVQWAREGCTQGYVRGRVPTVDLDQVCMVLDLYPEIVQSVAEEVVREVMEERRASVPTAMPATARAPSTPRTAPMTPRTAPKTPRTARTIQQTELASPKKPKTPRTLAPFDVETPRTLIPFGGEEGGDTDPEYPYAVPYGDEGDAWTEDAPSQSESDEEPFEALDDYEYEPEGWVIVWSDRTVTGPFNSAREAVEGAEQINCILAHEGQEYEVIPFANRDQSAEVIEFNEHPIIVAAEDIRDEYYAEIEGMPEVVIGSHAQEGRRSSRLRMVDEDAEERAAIMEYEGQMSREDAERAAGLRGDDYASWWEEQGIPVVESPERLYVPIISEAVQGAKTTVRAAKIAAKGVGALYRGAAAAHAVKSKVSGKVLDLAEGAVDKTSQGAKAVTEIAESCMAVERL